MLLPVFILPGKMAEVFRSNSAFWGWDGDYVREIVKENVTSMGNDLERFLARESPVFSNAEGIVSDFHDVSAEIVAKNDPSLRPSKRQQHTLTSVILLENIVIHAECLLKSLIPIETDVNKQ